MGGFNTYGEKSKKYGGAYPVWLTVSQKERGGGVLEELPAIGTVLRAGSLVSVDGAGGVAKIIETFELADNVSITDTSIRLYANVCTPKVGMNVMKLPATIQTTGAGLLISDVTLDNTNRIYIVTVPSGSLAGLKKGDVIIKADQAGTGASVYAIPTGLTENDVYVEDGDSSATIASVYHGEIMEDRIQPIPEIVKAVLPQIKFQKGL